MKTLRHPILAAVMALAVFLPTQALAAAATYTPLGGSKAIKIVCASGTCDAPTLLSQFIPMTDWTGFSVEVVADSGQTLSGAGAVKCYTWNPVTSNLPSYQQDLSLAPATASVRSVTLQGVFVAAATGYITCIPSGVTVSSGGVTLYVTGWTKR